MIDEEDVLEHFGVKGMKWGKHTARSPAEQASHDRKVKKAVKVTAGVVAVGGAALAVHLLSKNGHLPISTLRSTTKAVGPEAKSAQATAAHGKKIAQQLAYENFKKQAAALSKDIAEANAEQDKFMRSIGLGAVVNNNRP